MLQKLERFACSLAALLVLVIEACFRCCLRASPRVAGRPFEFGGEWIGPTLPQCWLAGALVARFYYLIHTSRADEVTAARRRHAFLRTWYWFLALASAEGCILCLGDFVEMRK